jgi:hypothetical protein
VAVDRDATTAVRGNPTTDHHTVGTEVIRIEAAFDHKRIRPLTDRPRIGALAHDGKVTQNYAKEMVNNVYEYVLLEKEIK